LVSEDVLEKESFKGKLTTRQTDNEQTADDRRTVGRCNMP